MITYIVEIRIPNTPHWITESDFQEQTIAPCSLGMAIKAQRFYARMYGLETRRTAINEESTNVNP